MVYLARQVVKLLLDVRQSPVQHMPSCGERSTILFCAIALLARALSEA